MIAPPSPPSPELLGVLARRFKALSDPARLRIVQQLAEGERTVSCLERETGIHQANLSKHLAVLLAEGFVVRRRDRSFALYRLAGPEVVRLCALAARGTMRLAGMPFVPENTP